MNEQNVASMKRYNVLTPKSYKDALQSIVKIATESSDFSRRTQAMLAMATYALGYTEQQRNDIHERTLQRSEKYKEKRSMVGKSRAMQELREQQAEEGLGGF
jgi:transcriptional regulator with AAA-type ATPase domain